MSNSASVYAFLAGIVFGLGINGAVLLPREATLIKSAVVLLLSLAFGGAISFSILLLGGTPRPMSESNTWLWRSGLVLGVLVGYFAGTRYAGRAAGLGPYEFGLFGGLVLAALFHWIAPAGTDTYAAAILIVGICGSAGFLWQWHRRKASERRD